MIKKVVLVSVLGSFLFLASCKKNEEVKQEMPGSETGIGGSASSSASIRIQEPEKAVVPADGKYPVMTFDKTEHDFGTIAAGSKVNYSFNLTNTGEADLVIIKAVGSCGCTVPEYPTTPIKPGASAKIKVIFNSAGKHGKQQKSVTLRTNAKEVLTILLIKASIKE